MNDQLTAEELKAWGAYVAEMEGKPPLESPPVLAAPEDPLALLRGVLWGLLLLTCGIFGVIGAFKLGFWVAAHI